MKILAIDTSNQVMSVALMDGARLIVERIVNVKRNHSIQLMPAIEGMMKEADWKPKELTRIVVAKGPGSYTGIRIGVTVAKALAFSLNVELVGVSSLEVLAANGAQIPDSYCVPIFDARRGNIYTGIYQYKGYRLVQIEKDTHVSAEQWGQYLKHLNGPIQLLGEDRLMHTELFEKYCGDKLIELPSGLHYPRASVLAERGRCLEPENVHLFEPEYLKLAEAEQNWMEAHPNFEKGGGWIEKL
ncbi:MAG: tRNA (adenosine(37)-N6)-threonylcarbamoyltransferase complex dimerization subunit type 1 TsaB [Alkalibacterium sp.]|uniref:tRNA (adenosine(37)-N6)-threonylcarbamoyltransferase complex dimerization subunit type 1 TsaB n=1 Tax=Alkalibacterium sp. TaxID=1872447 RepID=UPI0039710967